MIFKAHELNRHKENHSITKTNMLSFSVNAQVTCDVPAQMRRLIQGSIASGETHFLLEDIGDLYLGIADPHRKNHVSEDVNTFSYMKKCKWTKQARKNKYESNIISQEEEDDENVTGGVAERVLAYVETDLDRIADSSEFKYCLEQLYDMADLIEIEYDINIITAMLQAAKGNIVSIGLIKSVKDKYIGLSDLLFKVMTHEGWTEALAH